MGRAKNTLNAADVSSTPIKVKYFASYPTSSFSDNGIVLLTGSNISNSFYLSSSQVAEMNNYRLVKQLYYQNYLNGSLLGSASFFDPWWQSTAAVGTGDATVYQLPTASNEPILILSISPSTFGEQISRGTFAISASDSSYYIVDDGNGNLVDSLANNEHVGNIFYSQGIAVITNQDYAPNENNIYLVTEPVVDIYNTENGINIIIE